MTFLELAKKRYSVRNFLPKDVEQQKIKYLLECARLAPSAVNYQPWSCIIVKGKEACDKIRSCYTREWFNTAPLYLIICGNHEISWKRSCDGKDFCDVDAAIFTEHIALAAVEQGLGSCWVCNFDVEKCRKLFDIPAQKEPIAILPIGYPVQAEEQPIKKRKEIFDIVKFE